MTGRSQQIYFHLFDTEFGVAAIAWTSHGICAHLLPDKDAKEPRDRLKSIFPTAKEAQAPPEIVMLARRISKHLQGNVQDFSNVRLDLEGVSPFHAKIYQTLQKIPPGQTVSDNDLAVRCGSPDALQAVQQAMAENPLSVIVPCHRVLPASGSIGSSTSKRQLLQSELAFPTGIPVLR